jgi:hypothetical protein
MSDADRIRQKPRADQQKTMNRTRLLTKLLVNS